MRFRFLSAFVGVAALPFAAVAPATAQTQFIFNATFTTDDQVALFNFTVTGIPTAFRPVTLRTTSYAQGGFDTVLSLFDDTGFLLDTNDDPFAQVPLSTVPAEPGTGLRKDAFIDIDLEPGTYTVALTQTGNDPAGFLLSEGFTRVGQGNYTGNFDGAGGFTGPFIDQTGFGAGATFRQRTGTGSLTVVVAPEPGALALLGVGLGTTGIAVVRRRA